MTREAHPDRKVPEYSSKILELRESSGLTQKQFAAELETTNITVARWEGGTREPNEKNYAKLRDLAFGRDLKGHAEFFSSQIFHKVRSREHRLDEADALRFSQVVFDKIGNEEIERLAEFSRMNQTDFAKHQANRMAEAIKNLTNGEMKEAFNKIVFEAFMVKQLSMPGALDAFRRIRRLERDIDQLSRVHGANAAKVAETQHQMIKRILQGWAIAVFEGSVPDVDELEKDLAASNLLRATLARVTEVMSEKVLADREGRPYSDAEFIADLKRLLNMESGLKRLGKKPKGAENE